MPLQPQRIAHPGRAVVLTFVPLILILVASLQAQQPVKVATDPDKAGPDFAVQGEYASAIDKVKFGAEVVARGDGKFMVNLLPGGLRGEGGDYAKRAEGTAKTEGDQVVVSGKDGKWSAVIAGGLMSVKSPAGEKFNLHKVTRKSKTAGQKPPPGAVILFGGQDASEWVNGKIVDGNLLGSEIDSKRKFKDHKLHLEFRLSFMPFATGQGRSNSGVYPQHRYEVQVLDSFGLKGANNECGGIYSQAAPLVNMCYPPLQWQTYDIDFTTARFDPDGKKKLANARMTVWHNGVKIHDNYELKKGPTGGGRAETPEGGPLHLQGHGGQVQYRNIWVVETDKDQK
ncbi:MAG TPA: DUF1080 domain-containing protein [Gemmataceae bacterium]|nr:DUF1080 domain-containing protein [Gemmataceae bacterium]